MSGKLDAEISLTTTVQPGHRSVNSFSPASPQATVEGLSVTFWRTTEALPPESTIIQSATLATIFDVGAFTYARVLSDGCWASATWLAMITGMPAWRAASIPLPAIP